MSEELNIFFENVTKSLNINRNLYIEDSSIDPEDKTVNTCENQLCILSKK